MKKVRGIILLCVVFISANTTKANNRGNNKNVSGTPADTAKKDDSDDSGDDDYRSYEFGLGYGSDQGNKGIHDVKLPYITPSFQYTGKSGFFIGISDNYLLLKAKKGGFDQFMFNTGWDFDVSDNTTLGISYMYTHFRSSTPNLINSALNNTYEGYVDQSVGRTDLKLTMEYQTYTNGQQGDFTLSPEISHDFKWKWGESSSFTIMPEVCVDFGTRNFYVQYRKGKDTTGTSSKGNPKKNPPSTTTVDGSFGALDYTLSLTLKYKTGGFAIEPALNYNAPLYKSDPLIPSSSLAYFTLNLYYTIKQY